MKLFHIVLNFHDSIKLAYDYGDMSCYDEVMLIDTICNVLYDNHVKFIVSDNLNNNYGMDCKFDLPCLMESYHEILFGLNNKKDFSIDFYEQGREYLFSFIMREDNMIQIKIQHGYNIKNISQQVVEFHLMKEMFIKLFDSIFQFADTYISGIRTNAIFHTWKSLLNSLNL